MLKLKGLNKAIGDYHRANSGSRSPYNPRYGYLMLDKSTGEIWCDEFYSLGHNEWITYHSQDIINLGIIMEYQGYEINRENVKEFCFIHYQILSKYLKYKYIVDAYYEYGDVVTYEFERYKDALNKYKTLKQDTDVKTVGLGKFTLDGMLIQKLFANYLK